MTVGLRQNERRSREHGRDAHRPGHVAASAQDRIGPNRAGREFGIPFALLQPLADGAKMLLKEDVVPAYVNKPLYLLAPFIAIVTAMIGFAVIPFGPVGVSAVLSRTPLILAEADSHLGLTNRLLAPFARRVCLAFPLAGRRGGRYLVTGRPVPSPATDWEAARARFGIGLRESCVLVFGGSQGARSINHAAVEAFAGARFRVLHAAGERDLPDLHAPGPHYDLRGYVSRFSEALLASDLVVARAGGSIFEIAAHGKPAVLVPYPYATADHQTANAKFMEQAGAAVVIPDRELTPPRLALEVGRLLSDPSRLEAMARASASLARPNAARDVAHELLSVARGR